ncbi:BtpA/SgcQ family protein [Kitasatospora sp. NPDC085879]|uniref:BtpA/SgcQ family protein n=1 Tax=Kitasatospora sp. NPDC085879 TaxID=3154769 RepID=UPI0034287539
MSEFRLAPGRKTVIGMIHLKPLPGTPFHEEGGFGEILETAVASAVALRDGGADGCLVQTVDRVYSTEDECDPARAVAMGLVVDAVTRATGGGADFRVGVQIMRNALSASLAVAKVAGGSFIRAGALVGMTLSPHGMVQADPLRTAEYRRRIAADGIGVIAEVDSMHFRWFGEPKPTGEVARAARGMGADAVSLGSPDEEYTLDAIASVRRCAPGLPVLLAGHTDHANAARLLAEADGAFVGTCLEQGGWGGRIDTDRVKAYMDIARSLERP